MTATPEISRRWFGGRWRTSARDESSGNGGSVTDGAFVTKTFLITERATAGVYTATLDVLAGTRVVGVQLFPLAGPWAADSAIPNCGDTAQPKGYLDDTTTTPGIAGDLSLMTVYDPTNPDHDTNYVMQATNTCAYQGACALSSNASRDFPGVLYDADDTITLTVTTLIASPPVVPVGVTLAVIRYFTPVTAVAATFA